LLLGLGEGAVGRQHLTVADLHGGGVGGRTQALATLEGAPLPHLLDPGPVPGQVGLALLGTERLVGLLVVGDHQQVTHGSSSWCQFSTTTNGGRSDRQVERKNQVVVVTDVVGVVGGGLAVVGVVRGVVGGTVRR